MERIDTQELTGQEAHQTLRIASDSQKLTYWIGALWLLLTFVLADAAVLTWSARLVSGSQLIAVILAYLLVGAGESSRPYAVGNSRQTQLVRIQSTRVKR